MFPSKVQGCLTYVSVAPAVAAGVADGSAVAAAAAAAYVYVSSNAILLFHIVAAFVADAWFLTLKLTYNSLLIPKYDIRVEFIKIKSK